MRSEGAGYASALLGGRKWCGSSHVRKYSEPTFGVAPEAVSCHRLSIFATFRRSVCATFTAPVYELWNPSSMRGS